MSKTLPITTTQNYLYPLGFIQTQPTYFETPQNKQLVAICEDDLNVTYYNTSSGELVEVATSTVGDNNVNYELVNSLRTA